MGVDLEADKCLQTTVSRCYRRTAQPKEWIEGNGVRREPVKPETIFRQLDRKRRRMRSLLVPASDGLVWDEPSIPPAPSVTSLSVTPPLDIRLVLVGDPNAQPVDLHPSGLREMKNELLAIVEKFRRSNRLEMTPRKMAPVFEVDRDGLDPMDGILEHQKLAESEDDLVGEERVGGRGAQVEEKGSRRLEDATDFSSPGATPIQVFVPPAAVTVRAYFVSML